jgi:hypothetical protein
MFVIAFYLDASEISVLLVKDFPPIKLEKAKGDS